MAGVNKAILLGRLGADPEIRYTSNGTAVANFRIATNEGYGDKKTVQYHNIVAWNKPAEAVGNNLSKGDRVAIEGRLQHREYEGKDGVKRYYTEINMNAMARQLLVSKQKRQ